MVFEPNAGTRFVALSHLKMQRRPHGHHKVGATNSANDTSRAGSRRESVRCVPRGEFLPHTGLGRKAEAQLFCLRRMYQNCEKLRISLVAVANSGTPPVHIRQMPQAKYHAPKRIKMMATQRSTNFNRRTTSYQRGFSHLNSFNGTTPHNTGTRGPRPTTA